MIGFMGIWQSSLATGLIAGAGGVFLGILGFWAFGRLRLSGVRTQVEQMLEGARKESETVRKEAEVSARAEILNARERFEDETKARKQELNALERHLSQREAKLDARMDQMVEREGELARREEQLRELRKGLEREQEEIGKLREQKIHELERIGGMTAEQAQANLLENLERELQTESAALVRKYTEQAKLDAEQEARKVITIAIERIAAEHASDALTASVALPNDDMKGRIIGREGRNIRALEAATGVSVLIDDTPQTVVISGFDPVRKEIARQAMERLILDGRIHPTRIEEIVAKVRREVEETVRKAGEAATVKLGIQGVHPELIQTLGRLRYRTSYTQNVLDHSVEVANLMATMASELGLDVAIAKRIGLFHDIGKAISHEVEGAHAIVGAEYIRRLGESAIICNGVAAHHGEVEAESVYGILAGAADAISASRPGARAESTAMYIRRLQQLEEISHSFKGVREAYAIQAGREIRVIVEPDQLSDDDAAMLARSLSQKIEQGLQYPGQIQVTVIRETRAVAHAR